MIEKISHSAFKIFNECPHKFHLFYVDKVNINDKSIYLVFGSACHDSLEAVMEGKIEESEVEAFFLKRFDDLIQKELEEKYLKKVLSDKTLYELCLDMRRKGGELVLLAREALEKEFPGYQLVGCEKRIEKIVKFDSISVPILFKGFIDIVIYHEGKYYIIDWKTSSWGWGKYQRRDTIKQYQLTLYKHFFCDEFNLPIEQVETRFTLLKRTAKKNRIEFVKVGNGKRRIANCLTRLEKTLFLIEHGVRTPNFSKCRFCPFAGTHHCPGSPYPDNR